MKSFLRPLLTALACVAVAVGVTHWLVGRARTRPGAQFAARTPPSARYSRRPLTRARDSRRFRTRTHRPVRRPGCSSTRKRSTRSSWPRPRSSPTRSGTRARSASTARRSPSRRTGQVAAPAADSMVSTSVRSPSLDEALRASGSTGSSRSSPCTRGTTTRPGLARAGLWVGPDAGRAAVGPGPHDGLAGHQRPAAGRDGELHRLRRPVELHLPDRARGGPHAASRARARRSSGSPRTSTSGPATCASAGC